MADWTNLPNLAVGVGGLPSGTTVTALRDNPVAIAEGAPGAPRVAGSARAYNLIATASVVGTPASLTITDIPPHASIQVELSGFTRGSLTVSTSFRLEVSIDNGSNWVVAPDSSVGFFNVPSRGEYRFLGSNLQNFLVVMYRKFTTEGAPNAETNFDIRGFNITGKINAVRVVRTSGDALLDAGTINVYAITKDIG